MGRIAEIASAYVRVRPNLAGFKGETESGVRSAFSGVAKIIAGAFAVKGAFDFGKSAVEGAAQMQKSAEVIRSEFGSASAAVTGFADTAGAQLGISAQASEAASARFGILFKNLGIGQGEAAKMTVGFEQLGGALSAIKGTDPSAVLNSLTLAAAGNTRGLKQLGIVVDTTSIKQAALGLGLIKTTKDAITPGIKAQAIYALATQHLGSFMDQARAHAGDLTNVQRRLSAEWANAKDRLGAALLPAVTRLATILANLLPRAVEAARNAFGRLADALRGPYEIIVSFGGFIAKHQAAFEALGAAVLAVAAAFKIYRTALAIATAVQIAFNIVAEANPYVLIATAIIALVAALAVLFEKNKAVHDAIVASWNAVRAAFEKVINFGPVADALDWIGSKFSEVRAVATRAWEGIVGEAKAVAAFFGGLDWGSIFASLKTAVASALNAARSVFEAFKGYIQAWINFFGDLFHGRWQALLGDVVGIIKAALNLWWNEFKLFVDSIGPLILQGLAALGPLIVRGALAALEALRGAFSKLPAFIREPLDFLITAVEGTVKTIGAAFSAVVKVFEDIFKLVSDLIHARWGKVLGDLGTIALDVLKGLGKVLLAGLTAAWHLVTAAALGLGRLGLELATALINAIADGVKGLAHLIVGAFAAIWTAVKNAFVAAFRDIEKIALGIVLKILDPFSHLPSSAGAWARRAKDSVQAELDKISAQDAVTRIVDQVSGLPAKMVDPAKRAADTWGTTFLNTLTPYLTALTGQVTTAASTAATATGAVPGGGVGPAAAAIPSTGGLSRGRAKLIEFAKQAIGTPYLWGGAGPGGFDCSGLVQWAASQAGFSLPRTTTGQFGALTQVSLAQRRPGDIIFTEPGKGPGGGPGHEGIYIGGNLVLEAPHTGDIVKTIPLQSFLSGGLVGVGRIPGIDPAAMAKAADAAKAAAASVKDSAKTAADAVKTAASSTATATADALAVGKAKAAAAVAAAAQAKAAAAAAKTAHAAAAKEQTAAVSLEKSISAEIAAITSERTRQLGTVGPQVEKALKSLDSLSKASRGFAGGRFAIDVAPLKKSLQDAEKAVLAYGGDALPKLKARLAEIKKAVASGNLSSLDFAAMKKDLAATEQTLKEYGAKALPDLQKNLAAVAKAVSDGAKVIAEAKLAEAAKASLGGLATAVGSLATGGLRTAVAGLEATLAASERALARYGVDAIPKVKANLAALAVAIRDGLAQVADIRSLQTTLGAAATKAAQTAGLLVGQSSRDLFGNAVETAKRLSGELAASIMGEQDRKAIEAQLGRAKTTITNGLSAMATAVTTARSAFKTAWDSFRGLVDQAFQGIVVAKFQLNVDFGAATLALDKAKDDLAHAGTDFAAAAAKASDPATSALSAAYQRVLDAQNAYYAALASNNRAAIEGAAAGLAQAQSDLAAQQQATSAQISAITDSTAQQAAQASAAAVTTAGDAVIAAQGTIGDAQVAAAKKKWEDLTSAEQVSIDNYIARVYQQIVGGKVSFGQGMDEIKTFLLSKGLDLSSVGAVLGQAFQAQLNASLAALPKSFDALQGAINKLSQAIQALVSLLPGGKKLLDDIKQANLDAASAADAHAKSANDVATAYDAIGRAITNSGLLPGQRPGNPNAVPGGPGGTPGLPPFRPGGLPGGRGGTGGSFDFIASLFGSGAPTQDQQNQTNAALAAALAALNKVVEQALRDRRAMEDTAYALEASDLKAALAGLLLLWQKGTAAILDQLKGYVDQFRASGKALGIAFAEGLLAARAAVSAAAAALARAAEDMLRLGSPAKAGPMSDLDRWWVSLGSTLAGAVKPGSLTAALTGALTAGAAASVPDLRSTHLLIAREQAARDALLLAELRRQTATLSDGQQRPVDLAVHLSGMSPNDIALSASR